MRPLNDYFLCTDLADISTATTAYVVVPDGGEVVKILTVISGAIATADAVLTASINGTAITTGVVTVATASSAAWDQDSAEPTAANSVNEGDVISIVTDGASTNTVPVGITFVIRRMTK